MKYLIGCFFSVVLGGLFVFWLMDTTSREMAVAQPPVRKRGPVFPQSDVTKAKPDSPRTAATAGEGLSPAEVINVAVYERMNKSVVNITTKASRVDSFFLLEIPSEGSGSGSVLDKSGHILTNYHVIDGAREVAVSLYNGKTYDASFVGADPINDIAVVKIDVPRELLHPVVLGDSGRLRVGMRVFAIGNPFGLERTMTTGIISSLNRTLQIRGNRTIKSIIQIDAAVNPGNSGGPLLDTRGRIIGINTAIASKTGQSAGVGFAIPVNLVARVVPHLIQHGRVIRPEIGIARVYETEKGLLIARLVPDGPAEQAGLRGPKVVRRRRGPFIVQRIDRAAADLIVEVDGNKVTTADDFLSYIESKKPGEKVSLTIFREDRRIKIPVKLGGGEQKPAPRGLRS